MLLHFVPRDWFFIFLALVLCSYIKLASAKTQRHFQVLPPIQQTLTMIGF